MKALSILFIAILLFSLDAKAQSLSEPEFRESIDRMLQELYNTIEVPESYYKCAYDVYQIEGDAGEGFYVGYEVNRQCLLDSLKYMKFSDNGKKIWDGTIPVFINHCKATNEAYSQVLNVDGYCTCLHTQYKEREIPLHVLIEPEFGESNEFNKIAYYCIDKTQY